MVRLLTVIIFPLAVLLDATKTSPQDPQPKKTLDITSYCRYLRERVLTHYPRATFRYDLQKKTIRFAFNTRVFNVAPRKKTENGGTATHIRGPVENGIYAELQFVAGRCEGVEETGLIRERPFVEYRMAPYSPKYDYHLRVVLRLPAGHTEKKSSFSNQFRNDFVKYFQEWLRLVTVPTPSISECRARLRAAQRALRLGELERGAKLLRIAYAHADRIQSKKQWKACRKLRSRIRDLLRKHDRGSLSLVRAKPNDAASFLKLAHIYVRKGWFDTAEILIERAAAGDAEQAARHRTELEQARKKARGRPRGDIQQAIDAGIGWLVRNQKEDGRWEKVGAAKRESRPNYYDVYTIGLTGLALMCLCHEFDPAQPVKLRAAAERATGFLDRVQDPEGCFGTQVGKFMYSHAIATAAICQAHCRWDDFLLRRPAEKALAFIRKAQNPCPGEVGKLAWRYTVQPGDNDTSVTAWVVTALASLEDAGIEIPPEAAAGARKWLTRMTDPHTGRVGYERSGVSPARIDSAHLTKWPRERSEAITAAGVFCRILLGEDPQQSKAIGAGVGLCLKCRPTWSELNGAIDMYYWYFGTNALFWVGGDAWKTWSDALTPTLLPHQKQNGTDRGSWDPVGPWGNEGGRVYSTALMIRALQLARVNETR